MAIETKLECFYGEAVTLSVDIDESIASWTLTFALKEREDDEADLVTKTIGSGITVVSASAGTFTVALTAANTSQTPGDYVYAIARTNTGAEALLCYGTFRIKKNAAFQ